MKVFSTAVLLLGSASAVSGQQTANLRVVASDDRILGQGQGKGQGRPLTDIDSCVVEGIALLEIPGQTITGGDFDFACSDAADKGNRARKVKVSKKQKASLDDLVESGQIVFGETELDVAGGYLDDDGTVALPNGNDSPLIKKSKQSKKSKSSGNNGRRRGAAAGRSLLAHTGNRKVLAVRVIDVNGLAHPDSSQEMSYNIFGGGGDAVNFKSQIEDCSYGEFIASNDYSGFTGEYSSINAPGIIEAPGVMSVDIPIDITTATSRYDVRSAVTTAVQAKLGFDLPGPFDSVWYNLAGCWNDCGWAAYAYINSWNSVYQGNYYKYVGVQVHEIGHNLGLAHSGGLDGKTYTDHTGMMGNPLYSDEVGKMCFNPAKNWQLAWYGGVGVGPRKLLVNPQVTPNYSVEMVGVADYLNSPDKPVVVKIETGTGDDYFVGFNRAAGINSQNDEADNEVVITQTGNNGEGYSQSYLQAHLIQGEEHTITDFAGTGQPLRIKAENINIAPGTATVSIKFGDLCSTDAECDDSIYCNGAEICSGGLCQPGTNPCPSNQSCGEAEGGFCSSECHSVAVEITTDNYPGETSWQIMALGSTIVASKGQGDYTTANTVQDAAVTPCLPEGDHTFTINDSYGDGVCCGYGTGSYVLKDHNGDVLHQGGEFTDTESKTFTITVPLPTTPTPPPVQTPTDPPTKPPTGSPTASPSKAPTSSPTKAPTGSPTASPSKAPTSRPTTSSPTESPTSSPTPAPTPPPPTKSPTASPTERPSSRPSASPTSAPSTPMPTKSPTESPTQSPSSKPSASPTPKPSSSPSSSPTDVNECLVNNGGCDSLTTCTNIPNGRICGACPSGYIGNGETGCDDVDECLKGTDTCHANALCDNTQGGYTCTCNAGYRGDGYSCTDINECLEGSDNCDTNASCANTPGGYTCSCNAGFTGDGVTCTDIDECSAGNNGGCDPLTTCMNTPGSHYCTACPSGYTGTGEDGCVEIVFAFTDTSDGFMVTSRASVDPDPAADSCWGYSAGDSDHCTRDVPLGATLHSFIWADWMVDPLDRDFRKAEYEIKVNGDRNKDVLVFVPDAVKGNSYQLHVPLDELSPVPRVGDTVTVKLKIELDSGAKLQTQHMPVNIVDLPPEPTSSPTKAPSGSPTSSPTKAPTTSPSKSPSQAPTRSAAPTMSPSSSPTAAPVVTPSPTKSPSQAPTRNPTAAPTTSCTLPTGPNDGEWLITTTDGCTDRKVFDGNEDVTLIFFSDAIDHSSVDKIEVEFKVDGDSGRKTKFKLDSAADLSMTDPSFPRKYPDGTYRLTIRMSDIGRIGGWDGGVTSPDNDPIRPGEWTTYKFKVEDAKDRHDIQRSDLFRGS